MEIVIAIVGSAAVFGFVEFMIRRHDEKKGILVDIQRQITEICKSREEDKATDARRRILNASDEIRAGQMKHSAEWFSQLMDDISAYEKYCDDHSDYKNAKAMVAIERIKEVYSKALEDNDFA